MIRAVTFDLWNTLIEEKDYTAIRIDVLAKILRENGVSRTPEMLLEAYLGGAEYYRRMWEGRHRHFDLKDRLEHTLKILEIELPGEARRSLHRGFSEAFNRDRPELMDGVTETLKALSGRFRLGIISDTGVTPGRIIREHLRKKGILDRFSSTIFSDEIGYTKPHRVTFETALSQLGVEASEAIHVGDLRRTDVAGAKAAGMRTVWVKNNDRAEETDAVPDYTVSNLSQVLEIDVIRPPKRRS
ncbi:MAG TPA: HAD family hydrolase [Patescibacteria group bacterium]|nr:HAD family hydrolase [Patescibacteria group bacterium]